MASAGRHATAFGLVVVVGGLLGAFVAGVAVSVATVSASSVLAAKTFGHGFGRAGLQDPEVARERAEFAASFILERVDATEEQQAEVKRIVSETIGDLVPLAEEHRANRDALHSEFSQVVIDGEEIERIRRAVIVLAEQASRELTGSVHWFCPDADGRAAGRAHGDGSAVPLAVR